MATNNEKVSQLTQFYASELQLNDVFLTTDISSHTSKQLQLGQLMLFIENSGSFLIYNAVSASYVSSNNISGIVPLAYFSSQSISSSWAQYSSTASYVTNGGLNVGSKYSITSSWASQSVVSNSASYLIYQGITNGTSSYSLHSLLADNANSTYNLFYNGQPNGTASQAISSNNSITASYVATSSLSILSLTASSVVMNSPIDDVPAYGFFQSSAGTISGAEHGLGYVPNIKVVLRCTSNDSNTGYQLNDEICLEAIINYVNISSVNYVFPSQIYYYCDNENVYINRPTINGTPLLTNQNTLGFSTPSNPSNFCFKIYFQL